MARRIQSQIIPQPAVTPIAPVPPSIGLADIGALIESISRTGTAAARAQGREFQQERQVGAIERQAQAAEDRFEVAQIDQERLELQIEANQNRMLTAEAKVEIARLTKLEFLGFRALVDETPVDELPALYAEFPLADPGNQDAFARLIGARAATADETNLLTRLGESLSAQQKGAAGIEGPPLPTTQNITDVLLDLKEERAFDDPLIAAVYEQQLTSVAYSWRKNVELGKQKVQSQELANTAIEENRNLLYRGLEEMFAGDREPADMRALIDGNFPVVSAAIPSMDKTEYLDNFVQVLDDWAKSAPDLERSLAVVSEVYNLGEQYQRRVRGLKSDLTDAVKRQAITRESTRVRNLVDVAELEIRELGTEGSQSLGRLTAFRKDIPGFDLSDIEIAKLTSRADKEIAQLARSLGEQVELDLIFAGESRGIVSASAMATRWKNMPGISASAKLVKFASHGQLIPRVAATHVEDLLNQAPGEAASIMHTLENVSRNAAGSLIAQTRIPERLRALVNSTRGLAEDDPIYKQIIDGFAAPGALARYFQAMQQLGGELPIMFDEEGKQVIIQVSDSKFPQDDLIKRFLLSPNMQIDPSVMEDYNANFIAGWTIVGDDVTFAGAHPQQQIEFARTFATNAIERRYVGMEQRDGTRRLVRRDLLGNPTDDQVSAITQRMMLALQDRELEFGIELSIAWDAIQPTGETSLIPIGGIAITEDSEGPQFVEFIELDHATGLTRTINAVTDPGGFDEARLLFGDASKRLDPTVRLNWTPDQGSAVAVLNPNFMAVIGPDMIREGKKAWFELVGGRINVRSGDFGTFMDNFLATHNWQGAFPRPLLMQNVSSESLTGITLGAGIVGGATRRNVLLAGGVPDLRIGNQLANAPTPQQFDVEPGTDISLIPAAMQAIFEFANGDADLADKIARDVGWFVPEIED
jgi:hypothetical protein